MAFRFLCPALALLALIAPAAARQQSGTAIFSHDALADVLGRHVDADGRVDYQGLKTGRKTLDEYTAALGRLDPKQYEAWPEPDRIALLINAYNAFTLAAIIDNYPIKAGFFRSLAYPKNSIRQIPGVWDELKFTLMGRPVTLEHIEHEMLREHFNEPRIHMAINCASVGCPPLRNEPFIGDRLDEQLADQTRRFLADPDKFRIDRSADRVHFSPIFDWFGEDFVKTYDASEGFKGHSGAQRAVLSFIARHVDESGAQYLRTGAYRVKHLDYDWSLNEQNR